MTFGTTGSIVDYIQEDYAGTNIAPWEDAMGSFVRLLGFTTLSCGCIVGRYRELATDRDVNYVEEKGNGCENHTHRRNHTIAERLASQTLSAVRAS